MVKGWDPMSQVLNIIYIDTLLQYFLSVIYIITYKGFVFGLGDYPLSTR